MAALCALKDYYTAVRQTTWLSFLIYLVFQVLVTSKNPPCVSPSPAHTNTHTPVSAGAAVERGGGDVGNICSFSRASGTGLTMNLRPAE